MYHFHIILCISNFIFDLILGTFPSVHRTIRLLSTVAACRLQGTSLGQQVVSLLIGGEDGVLQVEEASGHAHLAVGVAPQGSADWRVDLVAPAGGGEKQGKYRLAL